MATGDRGAPRSPLFLVLERLREGGRWTPAERLVWIALADRAGWRDGRAVAWPGLGQLEQVTGLGRRSIQRSLGTLQKAGMVRRAAAADPGLRRPPVFELLFDAAAEGCQGDTPQTLRRGATVTPLKGGRGARVTPQGCHSGARIDEAPIEAPIQQPPLSPPLARGGRSADATTREPATAARTQADLGRQVEALVAHAVELGLLMPRRARRALREALRSGRPEAELREALTARARRERELAAEGLRLEQRLAAERAAEERRRVAAADHEAAYRRHHPPPDPSLKPLLVALGPAVQKALEGRPDVPGTWRRQASPWVISRVEPLALAPDGRLTLWIPEPGCRERAVVEEIERAALRLPGVSRVVLLFAEEQAS